jgi:pimeloyl-ACP methyl ester carboxylesterase
VIGFTDRMRATLARSPLVQVREIEGAGHLCMLDAPRAVNALIRDFVAVETEPAAAEI